MSDVIARKQNKWQELRDSKYTATYHGSEQTLVIPGRFLKLENKL